MKRIEPYLRRAIIAALLFILIFDFAQLVGLPLYRPLFGLGLVLCGRGPEFPIQEVVTALYRNERHFVIRRKILRASHIGDAGPAGLRLTDTPRGRFWEFHGERSLVTQQLAELESKYWKFERPVRPGDIVLDCGANIGTFSREALALGAKLVVAIEPAPRNLACLRKNLEAEIAAGRAIICPKGVWYREDSLVLYESRSSPAEDGFVRVDNTQVGPTVPLTTIDKLVSDLGLERVDFIKMDIEGAEKQALRGALTTLARYHPRMEISVDHLPEDPRKVPEIVRYAWPGYRVRCLQSQLRWNPLRVEAGILFFQ